MNSKVRKSPVELKQIALKTTARVKPGAGIEELLTKLNGEVQIASCLLHVLALFQDGVALSSLGIPVMEVRLRFALSEMATRITSTCDRLRTLGYISKDCWMILQTELAVNPSNEDGESPFSVHFRIEE